MKKLKLYEIKSKVKKYLSLVNLTNIFKEIKSSKFIDKSKQFLIKLINKIKSIIILITNKSSIKSKIFISFIALILTVVIALGGISAFQSYNITFNTLEQTMNNVAEVSSNSVANKLEVYRAVASNIGLNQQLSDTKINNQEKSVILEQMVEMYGLLDAYTTNAKGRGDSPVTHEIYIVNDMDFFNAAMEGNTFITEPKINEKLDKVTFTVSAPLWKDGIYGSTVSGIAVIVLDGQVLSDIASSVKVGEQGVGFILNKDGYTIAHPEYDRVLSDENIIKSFEADGSNKSMATIEQKMLGGDTEFADYEINNKKHLIAYSPVEGSNGWGFFISAPQSEYMGSTNLSIIITLIISVLSLILAYITGKILSNNLANPIKECAERLKQLAEGDLHTEIERTTRDDEIGLLIKSLKSTVKGINIIINDISYNLGAIADGDFSKEIDMEYNGDFNSIALSMKKISKYLNNLVSQVNESAEQVACGSEQLAGGAQALSQGATEQASSVEELSAAINEMTEQINRNALNANKANEASLEAEKQVENSNNYVKEMNEAMTNIKDTSTEIGKIIKVIDTIAFQTNILALNAAVEAARAGSAGNGFAVVANEVKNLASKSAEAAKNTETLIENSISAVEKGSKIAAKTKNSLNLAVEKSKLVEEMINEITEASQQQAVSASQVLAGIEQISFIVQTNSATAEESAAASEELSGQAQVLKELVEGIKLNDTVKNY
ncbi:MAG: methyl-accepting chemotaxis protein [Sedimentibacter sp.]